MPIMIPTSTNRLLTGALLLLHIVALFVLPALHAPALAWGLLLTAMIWLTIVHWGLIHEAIHKVLLPNPQANETFGRILAISMGTSFHVLRFGHLMHHQHNRNFMSERVEHNTLTARAHYYAHLLFGTYLIEIVTGLLLLILPRATLMKFTRATLLKPYENVAATGERFFYQRGNIHKTRLDVAATIALYTAAFYLAGPQYPWLLAFIAIRGLVISFMDNIYHYDTPADNSKAAKELALPNALSALILHGNYHETHHTNPNVPWNYLPQYHAQQYRRFDGDLLTHGLMQFQGPTSLHQKNKGECYA